PPFLHRYHYVAVTGFDDVRGYVLYQDGYSPDEVDDYESFQDDWHGGDHWALVVFPPERTFSFLSADDHRELAALCEPRESWDAAAAHLRAVLELEPDDADALVGLASALSRGGHADDATREFERALARAPGDARAMNNFAQHLVRSGGDLARAEELARAALASAPALAGYVDDTLGQVLAARGDREGARAAFAAALAQLRTDQDSLRRRVLARLEAIASR
ncbi:MAG TPA: tetratricopeptide repeat protein, partial [Planctomycetota bacterium]|nr:tetratricopeptide repeat protein [Planctomycetota bacterium]